MFVYQDLCVCVCVCVCVIAQEKEYCSVCVCVCVSVWNCLTTGIQEHGIDVDSGCVSMLWSEGLHEGLERRNTDVSLRDGEMIDPL